MSRRPDQHEGAGEDQLGRARPERDDERVIASRGGEGDARSG